MQERIAWLSELCTTLMQWCAQFRCSCNSLLHWNPTAFGQELYDHRNWASHYITFIREDELDVQRRLFCNSEPYVQLHIVLVSTSNTSSRTHQSDSRWCLGWRDMNYMQVTIVYCCRIISSMHSTCPLLSAWMKYWRCAMVRCLYNSGPNAIGFLWRREWSKRRNSTLHWCSDWFGQSCISGPKYM